jgi:hypothetical protein
MHSSKVIKIYGIVFADRRTEYEPIRNDHPIRPWRWENDPMITVVDTNDLSDVTHMGVFSHKFKIKTGFSKNQVIQRVKENEADVYNFARRHNVPNFMDWSDQGHKGIKKFIQACCDHCGLQYTNDLKYITYANLFVATKSVYVDYINTVIKPSLELLEGPLWEEVNVDAGYTKAMEKEKLKFYTGLDYYNFIPFCLERMMNMYIFSRNLKCIDFNKR